MIHLTNTVTSTMLRPVKISDTPEARISNTTAFSSG
jgi:hypothetical protein